MTKKEWLKRAEMIYELGMVDNLILAKDATDYFMRHKCAVVNDDAGSNHQEDIANDIMNDDIKRTDRTLANDTDLYQVLEALCIMTKDCQDCATNKDCWHCRGCMFNHITK